MSTPYTFRQFQEELAGLDGSKPTIINRKPLTKKELEAKRLEKAKTEFLALKDRHQWTLEQVVAFFPPEEGVDYLRELLNQPISMKKRGRKPKT